ncbi:hypothetical protein GUJ93_ZPchr0006g42944 [Zizania palustris]|uniref:Uncharacterized protein n=1 Tax=Zizania palustris TaxID=103762 RepID=A0A8J5SI01_ZIZPA|nr:hypothetical protein GUJ93_ZPchr0006g42944 [Zizania palustris]
MLNTEKSLVTSSKWKNAPSERRGHEIYLWRWRSPRTATALGQRWALGQRQSRGRRWALRWWLRAPRAATDSGDGDSSRAVTGSGGRDGLRDGDGPRDGGRVL